jgi:hypothetical protein
MAFSEVKMEAPATASADKITAVYDRVVREARQTFGPDVEDDQVVRAAHEAVDEFIVRQNARVITFVPVLAMRRLRDSATSISDDEGGEGPAAAS